MLRLELLLVEYLRGVIHQHVLAERVSLFQNAPLAPNHALLDHVEPVDGGILFEHHLHRRDDLDGHGERQLQLEVVVNLPLVSVHVDAAEVVHPSQPIAVQLLDNLALHLARRAVHDVLPPVAVAFVVPEDVVAPQSFAQARVPRVQPFLRQETVEDVHAVVKALVPCVQRGDRADHASHEIRVDETRREVAQRKVQPLLRPYRDDVSERRPHQLTGGEVHGQQVLTRRVRAHQLAVHVVIQERAPIVRARVVVAIEFQDVMHQEQSTPDPVRGEKQREEVLLQG